MSQEKPPAVGVIPGPQGYSGKPGDNGRLDGVLKENSQIKISFPQLRGKPYFSTHSIMYAGTLEYDDIVNIGTDPVKLCHPGLCQHSYFCVGEAVSDRRHRRETHDDIPDPVCSPHQYVFDLFRDKFFRFSCLQHIK